MAAFGREHDDEGGTEPTQTMFRRRTVLGSLLPGSLGLALAGRARAADAVRIVGSADVPPSSLEAMERLRGGLEETTRGRFAFTIDGEGAADDKAALEQVRSGQATLGWVRVAEIAELAPELAALTVPFLFMDQRKMMGLLERTSIAPLLNDQLRKQGLEPLAYLDGGSLRLAGATLTSLSGLQGRQIAARPGMLRMAAFEALGLTLLAGTPQPQQAPGESLLELRTDDLAGIAAGGPGLVIAEPPHAHDLWSCSPIATGSASFRSTSARRSGPGPGRSRRGSAVPLRKAKPWRCRP